jgi:hypothetical protein
MQRRFPCGLGDGSFHVYYRRPYDSVHRIRWPQWHEMHDGGAQTDRIIAADERIATAMETTAQKASDSLKENRAASRVDQRAWLGVKDIKLGTPLKIGQKVDIEINSVNSGKTPALDVRMTSLSMGINKVQPATTSSPDSGVVAPGNNQMLFGSAELSDTGINFLLAAKVKLYVRGRIEYKDIFGASHTTTFCAYYPTGKTLPNFFNCTTGNHMD